MAPGPISQGFIFPEAEQISIEEAYSDGDIIGWYFRSVLRQPFDYSKYPFDQEDVWIRIWNRDFHRDVVLIPDLDSYDNIRPATKPGIEHDFVLEGWEIQDSHFSYRNNSYNANFGIENDKFGGSPELYFNIGTNGRYYYNTCTLLLRKQVFSHHYQPLSHHSPLSPRKGCPPPPPP